MAVKRSQTGARILTVLDLVAAHQPIVIAELARLMGADKSAVHRTLMTLADSGWVRPATGKARGWELTAHIHELSQLAHGSHDLRLGARPTLQALRDETGETVTLNVAEQRRFVVIEVVESRQPLRVVLSVGETVPALRSATGRAILPYLPKARQMEFLTSPADALELEEYAATISRGYAISSGIVVPGFTNVGAPIFEAGGRPVGALLVTGPTDRLESKGYGVIGDLARAAALKLSRGVSPGNPVS